MDYSRQNQFEERTAVFGETVIELCKSITRNEISKPLISQLIRSSTSIGANYMEANCASSKKDFANKIFICKKEAQETKHWLRMLLKYDSDKISEIDKLSNECQQLILIFQKITSSLRSSNVK